MSSAMPEERAASGGSLGDELAWTPARRPARVELHGEHVAVRPLDPVTHAEPLYAESHAPEGDPAIWTYLPYGPYPDVGDLRRDLMLAQASEDPLYFTLCRLPDGCPRGIASYLRITAEHGVIEIGHIWFGVSLRHTTAATEAIYLLAAHAFDDLGYRRLEWKCNALNTASRRAAERFGFAFEGVFRNHQVVKGRNRDTAWYAVIDDDWPAVRAGFQAWLSADNFDREGRQRRGLTDFIQRARN